MNATLDANSKTSTSTDDGLSDDNDVSFPMSGIEIKFLILICIFISCMGFINLVSAKLWSIWGLTISGGIIAYWITFPITDAIGEVFGKGRAFLVVWLGFLANILVLFLSQVAIQLPPADVYSDQRALESVMGAVPVIVFASLVAYLLAQLHDVWAFGFWRRITNGKALWLRNNLSTASSQLIDSVIFNFIAFYAFAEEKVDFSTLVSMTAGYWLFKLLIALIDTPIVYLLVAWLRRDIRQR